MPDKKIEKLKWKDIPDEKDDGINKALQPLQDKINEIIDVTNKIKEIEDGRKITRAG
jgi:hypothetical protein